jgi:hypothetical protein
MESDRKIHNWEEVGKRLDIIVRKYEYDPSACPGCGLKLEGTISYCCSRSNCPIGLGSSTSYTGGSFA